MPRGSCTSADSPLALFHEERQLVVRDEVAGQNSLEDGPAEKEASWLLPGPRSQRFDALSSNSMTL